MRYSELFGNKTLKEAPKDEVSISAQLLIRAGFISKELSGVYNFLPLGFRVLNKIANIIREEMNAVGGQEILLSALQNKQSWEKTGRWDKFDALFKLKSRNDTEYALGPTHEEVLIPLAKQFIQSYKDLPLYPYQIQNKFRDEARSKSGILRTREFLMKDLYSFHKDQADLENYYEEMKKVYRKVFERMGLNALETEASGGTFSKFSHEYQVLTSAGEDTIYYCKMCNYSQNEEVATIKEGDSCPKCQGKILKGKAIEVGNIFPLQTKFSEIFNVTYKDKNGEDQLVYMGCYGIGLGRVMGTIIEVNNDQKGMIWPKEVAPYQVHLINLANSERAGNIYNTLKEKGIEILWDDRDEASAGEKFAAGDLIGLPVRLVISEKTGDKVEWKERSKEEIELLSLEELIKKLA